MSVLQRQELEASPLADLHAIASELGLEGYRSLRKADLIGAILKAQGGDAGNGAVEVEPEPAEEKPKRSRSRSRSRSKAKPKDEEPEAKADEPEAEAEPEAEEDSGEPEATVSGVLDILPNGSGFLRVNGVGQSSEDPYISPAQIRRCELRAGDEVSGPVRPPRRNERHPSLVRVESVNGGDPEPVEGRKSFEELTAVFATDKLKAPKSLKDVPLGKGSRVAVGGPPGAGATTLLREVAAELGKVKDLALTVVLVGVRPEEVTDWKRAGDTPVVGGGFDTSIEAQVQAADLAVERAKRTVERGGDAALVIDSLEALPPAAQRRVFGAARKLEEGGSLTIFASTGMAWEAQRYATTRVMLEPPSGDSEVPKVAASRSGTLRADLLGK